jgi:acetylornithine aminotransferase
LIDSAVLVGKIVRQGLREGLADCAGVVDIRGRGLMIGVELDRPCGELVTRALKIGLLINVTADKVVRLLPPLIFSADDARELVSRLTKLIRDFLAAQ